MRVKVELKETSQPIELTAVNAYTKGAMYCVYLPAGVVQKFPLANVWRVTEDYRAQDNGDGSGGHGSGRELLPR